MLLNVRGLSEIYLSIVSVSEIYQDITPLNKCFLACNKGIIIGLGAVRELQILSNHNSERIAQQVNTF